MLPSMPGEALGRVPNAMREEAERLGRLLLELVGASHEPDRDLAAAARAVPDVDRATCSRSPARPPPWRPCATWPSRRRITPERFLDLADRSARERQELIERLTIRTTWFMREPDAILALAAAFKKRAAVHGSPPGGALVGGLRHRRGALHAGDGPGRRRARAHHPGHRHQRRGPRRRRAGPVPAQPHRRAAPALAAALLPVGGGRPGAGGARHPRRGLLRRAQPRAVAAAPAGLGDVRRRRLPERAALLRPGRGRAPAARAVPVLPGGGLRAAERGRAPAGLVDLHPGLRAQERDAAAAPAAPQRHRRAPGRSSGRPTAP